MNMTMRRQPGLALTAPPHDCDINLSLVDVVFTIFLRKPIPLTTIDATLYLHVS